MEEEEVGGGGGGEREGRQRGSGGNVDKEAHKSRSIKRCRCPPERHPKDIEGIAVQTEE